MNPQQPVLIVTVGNEFRGDDGAGIALHRRISEHTALAVLNGGMAPENIIGDIASCDPAAILIIDTMNFGGNAGDIMLASPDNLDNAGISTHGSLSLFAECLGMVRGGKIRLLGIQPDTIAMGEGLSPAVRDTIGRLATLFTALQENTDIDGIERMICERFDPAESTGAQAVRTPGRLSGTPHDAFENSAGGR